MLDNSSYEIPIQQNFPGYVGETSNCNMEQAKNKKPRCASGILNNNNSHIPRDGNRGFIFNNRILELKSIIKIDIDCNPRDEISYFEDMCHSLEIFDQQVRYQVLISVWPHRDIKIFYTLVEYGKRV